MTQFSPYDDRPLVRFLRFVSRSFRIGVAFGVEVRMFWAALVVMPLLFASWAAMFAATTGEVVTQTAIQFTLLFTIIWTHEMGHIVAGRRYGIRSELITLSPIGGVAHLSAPAPTPRAEIVIALAGPAVHLLWLAICWPLYLLVPADLIRPTSWTQDPIHFTLWFLVTMNTALMLFNLLPFFPLDGGRATRGLLAMRWHPNRVTLWAATAGMVGGGLMMLLALTRGRIQSTVLLVIGLSIILACVQERRMARHADIYANRARAAWESDPDSWKRGDVPAEVGPRRSGFFKRWQQRRADRNRQLKAEADRALSQQLDLVLERLQQVGMKGLDNREKAVLLRASKKKRDAG